MAAISSIESIPKDGYLRINMGLISITASWIGASLIKLMPLGSDISGCLCATIKSGNSELSFY
jgi:hypothetical protein